MITCDNARRRVKIIVQLNYSESDESGGQGRAVAHDVNSVNVLHFRNQDVHQDGGH